MKYLFNIVIFSTLLMATTTWARCCPGTCCPKVDKPQPMHFSDITTYLVPYTSKAKLDKVKQEDLARFLVKEKQKKTTYVSICCGYNNQASKISDNFSDIVNYLHPYTNNQKSERLVHLFLKKFGQRIGNSGSE